MEVNRLKAGDHVRTVDGSIVVVLIKSEDGAWILVKYESAPHPDLIGTEDLCSADDLAELVNATSN